MITSLCCSLYSYYIYNISHPNKSGIPQINLAKNPEAQIDEGTHLSPSQIVVERVITKVFRHHHCEVVITDRVRSLFTLKLWRMGKAINGLGGTARKKKYEQWRESTWVVELKGDEIILPANLKIRHPKNTILNAKHTKLEEELDVANSKIKDLTDRNIKLQKSCDELSRSTAVEAETSAMSNTTRKRKSWQEYTPQYRNKRIRQVANKVQAAVSFAKDDHLKATKIELTNEQTGDVVSVNTSGQIATVKQILPKDPSSSSNIIDQTLYVKEKYNVSNEAYHEMARVHPEMPRLNKLLKKADTLNSKSTIKAVPGRLQGVQQSIQDCLEKRLARLQRVNPSFCSNREVRVKITGDGTVVSRSVHLVVIALVIVHNETVSNSPNDHSTIALVNCKENYQSITESVTDLVTEMKTLNVLKVGEYTYKLTYFLGADMKFLAMALGIEAANSTYSCVWCKCPSKDRHDITKKWSVMDTENGGARTIDRIQKCSQIRAQNIKSVAA